MMLIEGAIRVQGAIGACTLHLTYLMKSKTCKVQGATALHPNCVAKSTTYVRCNSSPLRGDHRCSTLVPRGGRTVEEI